MEIEFKGANSVVIKAGATSVVVDPKLSLYGQKDLKVEGMIELATDEVFAIKAGQKILITGPGEYEISDVSVKGIAAQRHLDEPGTHHATIYQLGIGGYRVAILGHIRGELSEDQLESLGVIDVLIIPVGGNGYTLDGVAAASVTRQIDPKIVIPTHYADSGLKYDVPQNKLDDFLTNIGAKEHETLDKFKLKSGAFLPEVLTLIELKRS